MGTPLDYIYKHELQLQPSFKGSLETPNHFGYRGELLITPNSKSILKHAIIVTNNDNTLLFAGELDDFDNFETLYTTYKTILASNSIITLFVNNLISDTVFQYEGLTIYAFALDESSVWNELLSYADLDKKELKKMGAEEKIDALYTGIKSATLYASKKTYEEACALKMS